VKHPNHRLYGRGSALPPYCIAARRRPLIGRSTRHAILALATAMLAVVLAVAALARPRHSPAPRPAKATASARVSVAPRPVHAERAKPNQPSLAHTERAQRVRLLGLATPFYCGRSTVREVAITFDDGPGPRTHAILALLRQAKVHATFFEIGVNALRHPVLARAEAKAGEVGDHTLDHKNLAKLTPAGVRREIDAGKAAVRSATGVMPVLFRPPYEATDATIHRLIRRAGLLEVLWSVDSRDWQNGSALQLRRRVTAELHPGGIVLLHEQAVHTLPTLRWLLAELRRRRLRPVTVSQLLADAAPRKAQLLADRRGHACVEFPYHG
jgi:peptidoglycan/xylan/chitin deacetylase (PgdA/CDA1 family)